jgi:hypothetical protein
MSAANEKPSIGREASFGTMTVASPSKSWSHWRVVQALRAIIGWLKQGIYFLMPSDGRTAEERRVAKKARQKEIRRQLRGLPPTTDSSNASEQPTSRPSRYSS